jgi:peroxiredoxin
MRRGILPLTLIVFTLTVSALFAGNDVTSAFPDFTLKSCNGDDITLSEITGEGPTIVTFWATWCKPCIKELRKLEGMSKFLEKHGVTVLAINEDGPRTRPKVKPFTKKEGWTFNVLMDPGSKVKTAAGVAELPKFFIVGEGNAILYQHPGYKPGDEAEYREKIETLFPVAVEEIPEEAVE